MLSKAQMTVCCWKGKEQLNETIPNEKAHGVSHSDTSINENHTDNSFNKVTMVVQGPSDDNDKMSHGKHVQWRC